MSIQKIEIPENPSYQQLQELQYEVTQANECSLRDSD